VLQELLEVQIIFHRQIDEVLKNLEQTIHVLVITKKSTYLLMISSIIGLFILVFPDLCVETFSKFIESHSVKLTKYNSLVSN
jgi:hypothetical protein